MNVLRTNLCILIRYYVIWPPIVRRSISSKCYIMKTIPLLVLALCYSYATIVVVKDSNDGKNVIKTHLFLVIFVGTAIIQERPLLAQVQ